MTNHITGVAGLLAVGLLLVPIQASAVPIRPTAAPEASDAFTLAQYGYGYGRGYGRGYGYGHGRRHYGGPRFGYGYGRPRLGYRYGYGRGYGYGRRGYY